MAAPAVDPYYDRKRVPKELLGDVGITDLTPQEEYHIRERKYSRGGGDIRKFSNPSTKDGKDPYYQRKRVSDAEIAGVGATGLTSAEEYQSRERKYSLADGSDVRAFSNKVTPQSDPFYGRRRVSTAEISGVGDTGNTPVQDYEIRERKQSLAQLSDDPFKQLAGSGHRSSISAGSFEAASAATERRRSSLAALYSQKQRPSGSGTNQGERLQTIESRVEEQPNGSNRFPPTHATVPTSQSSAPHAQAPNQYTFEDDPDSVAPDEIR